MQVMKLDDGRFEALRAGDKTRTVRLGRRDVALGPLRFEGAKSNNLSETVMVRCVTFLRLIDIPEEVLVADGFDNHEHALKVLTHYYGDEIDYGSEVTVIYFNLREDVL